MEFENLKVTELRLGLPGMGDEPKKSIRIKKRALEEDSRSETKSSETVTTGNRHEATEPAAKAQVVGWPPVRSYRKNTIQAWKNETEASGTIVKVSMDGAPYLRKIDLKVYNGYKELREGLESMFKCFSVSELWEMEGCNYAITYEDKDGDWMLVGDVPWGMFISSCKRLRIMRGFEGENWVQTHEDNCLLDKKER